MSLLLLWEALQDVFTKAVSMKPYFKKKCLREWLKEPQGAGEREGVCQTTFICGMVMTLFLQSLGKLSASCLLSACSQFLSLKLKHMQWIPTFLKSCQEIRQGSLGEERRWGGGIWSCAAGRRETRRAMKRKNCREASEPLMLAGSERSAYSTAGT